MRLALLSASAVLMTAATASSLPAQQASPRYYDVAQADNAPQIDLWLDQDTYRYGDRIVPYFDTDPGAYVTIVRVTSDGALTVLYPRRPKDQQPFQRSQLVSNRIPFSSYDGRFNVSESDGIGFVFAIASYNRFNYAYFTQAGLWNRGRLAYEGGIGDPFEIVHRFVDRTLGENADFSMDYASYQVIDYGTRSRYSTRYAYNDYSDYYDSCLSAFGFRYTSYCQRAYPGYYGQIIVAQPRERSRGNSHSVLNLSGKKIKPVVGDPLVGGAPVEGEQAAIGRLPNSNSAEAAAEAAARRDRWARQVLGRDRAPSQVETRPTGGQAQASSQPSEPIQRRWLERPPVIRTEPRVEQPRLEQPRIEQPRIEQPRIEQQQREAPRVQYVAPVRVEVRRDPTPAPVMQRAIEPASQPATTGKAKDH